MRDLLSIIVPVYNSEKYLGTMIESVLKQSYNNFELILVNDGSTDQSKLICDRYRDVDSRIKVLHKENGGQGSARNAGLELAKGKYIAFADNDDIVHPDLYETLINVIEEKNCLVCACYFENVKQERIKDIVFKKPDNARWIDEKELIRDYFTPTWKIPIWNKVYKREILDGLVFSNVHLGEDNRFSYEIIKRCKGMSLIETTMYFQRMHGENFEYTGSRYLNELLSTKEEILKDIKGRYAEEYSNAACLFLYECVRIFNYYFERNDKEHLKNTLEILIRNINLRTIKNMPLGRKRIFMKIKYFHKKIMNKSITI